MSRGISFEKAKRQRTPMLVGIIGPSGSGKTYSALRMAAGMAKVTGGRVKMIDTEACRGLHYADDFDFDHAAMSPPFSPLAYLEAIRAGTQDRNDVLIVDSMSHEHEGEGGLLEMHEAELERMAGSDFSKRERVKFLAWVKPKQQRRRLINAVVQMGVNAVFCFRAKEKTKPVKGGDPIHMGWQPIAGEEFIFEMLVNVLLYPGAGGVPNWAPDEASENAMLKLPSSLEGCFAPGKTISEETGERIARWAMGPDPEHEAKFEALLKDLKEARGLAQLTVLGKQVRDPRWDTAERSLLVAAGTARKLELEQPDEVTAEASVRQPESPASGDPAEPGDDVEIDPETGEVIPPEVGAVWEEPE